MLNDAVIEQLLRAVLALVTDPGRRGGTRIDEIPAPSSGDVLVQTLEVGICGTDREIHDGWYGTAPEGADRLVLGHEVVGVVRRASRRFRPGDLVVATVRRGCDGCRSCDAGAFDSCMTGRFRERGIEGLDGFGCELFAEAAENLVAVPAELGRLAVLTEPLSVCERGFRHAQAVADRQPHDWSHAVVLGVGAIGMLSVLLLRRAGLRVTALARDPQDGERAALVRRAGATYAPLVDTTLAEAMSGLPNVDLLVEATGSADRVHESLGVVGRNGVLCLLGVDSRPRAMTVPSIELAQRFVDENKALLGSVNAGARDWTAAVASLTAFRGEFPGLLEDMIGLRADPGDFARAFAFSGVKATLRFA